MNEKYKLYALRSTEENIDALGKERFVRATAEYLLWYTEEEKPDNAIEVGAEYLTIPDIDWIRACNEILLIEQMWKQEKDIAAKMGARIEALETELKKQKESLENGTGTNIESDK